MPNGWYSINSLSSMECSLDNRFMKSGSPPSEIHSSGSYSEIASRIPNPKRGKGRLYSRKINAIPEKRFQSIFPDKNFLESISKWISNWEVCAVLFSQIIDLSSIGITGCQNLFRLKDCLCYRCDRDSS